MKSSQVSILLRFLPRFDAKLAGAIRDKARLASLAVVLLGPVVLLSPALRPGFVLSSADNQLDSFLLAEARPANFRGAQNGLIGDTVCQMIPWRRLVSDELRAGRIPFWNPHAFAGSPLLGNAQSGVFDPLAIPYLFVKDPSRATVWVALLRMWVAGLGVWFLARRLGASFFGSALSGVIYSLGGFTVVWLMFPLVSSSAWFPWVILAVESLATRQSSAGFLGFSLTLCAATLGGHVEVAFYTALAASLYFVWRRIQLAGWQLANVAGAFGWLATAGALIFALSAIQVLPLLEAIPQGGLAENRDVLFRNLPSWPLPMLDRSILLLFPYLFGRPLVGEVDFGGPYTNFCEQSGAYGSLLGFMLALLGFFLSQRRTALRPIAFIGLLAWLHSINFPPLPAVTRIIPVLKLAPSQRGIFIALLALAIGAGFGLDAFAKSVRKRIIIISRGMAVLLGFFTLFGASVAWWMIRGAAGWQGFLQKAGASPLISLWYTGKEQYIGANFPKLAHVIAHHYMIPWAITCLLAALVLFALYRFPRQAGGVAIAVVSLDLLYFGWGYNPAIPQSAAYPQTQAIADLWRVAGDNRILAMPWILPSNVATYYGLDEVLGYDAIGRRRIERLLQLSGSFPEGPMHWRTLNFDRHSSPVIDLLSISAIASAKPLEGSNLELVSQPKGGFIYRNTKALPRCIVPSEVVVVGDLDAADHYARTKFPNPSSTVLVESEATASLPAGAGNVVFKRLSPGRIDITAAMTKPGVVLVSEAYDPPWRATIDGVGVRVYPADLALMAVVVPAGEHHIEFFYRPRTWTLALFLLFAGLVVIGVISVRAVKKSQNSPHHQRPILC